MYVVYSYVNLCIRVKEIDKGKFVCRVGWDTFAHCHSLENAPFDVIYLYSDLSKFASLKPFK